jgi:hypothetical protein
VGSLATCTVLKEVVIGNDGVQIDFKLLCEHLRKKFDLFHLSLDDNIVLPDLLLLVLPLDEPLDIL